MKPDTLIKIRDGIAQIFDAIQEELETQASRGTEDHLPDLSQVIWKQTVGPKGPFDVTTEDLRNPRYVELLQSLKQHSGTMTISSYFVWLMPDGKTIGRKPARKA